MRQLNKRDAWQLAVAGVALGERLHHIRQGESVVRFTALTHRRRGDDPQGQEIHLKYTLRVGAIC